MVRLSVFRRSAGALLLGAAVILSAPQAQAFNNILNTWQGIYGPGGSNGDNSLSGDNASCELCHADGDTGLWNGYGSQLEVLINSGTGAAAAMLQIENNPSVNIGGGTSFRDEIQADAQPGWTTGTNNTIYNNGAVVDSTNVPPPANIGDLDPAAPPVNQPPVANDDSDTTLHDAAVTIDVLANDTDDGLPVPPGAISINSFDTVSLNGGTVSCAADCSYTPPAGFVGSDSFTYDVTDGDLISNTATVTVTVTNTAPVANDDVASTEAGVSVTIDVLVNDIDADGDAISINTFDVTSGNGGTVSCTTDCLYTPPGGFTGDDTFTYDITDGIATSNIRAIVTIMVTAGPDNEPPLVSNPGPQTNSENDAVSLQIVASDNVAIASYSASGLPTGLAIDSGTGVISGTVSFDAVVHPALSDIFATTVTVTDTSGNSTPVSFDWTVDDVNRAPVANDDTASTAVDTLVNIDVLANDTDADGDTLTIGAFDATSVNGGTVSCAATCDYTPAAGFTGGDSFSYTADDGFGGSDVATVTVTVTAGPDLEPPVVENPGAQTNSENDAVSLQIVASDNVAIASYSASGLPTGLAIDSGTGVISGTVSFDAVVHPDLSGVFTSTVTVTDTSGNSTPVSFDWTVNDLNQDPVAVDDAASTPADTAVTVDVLANDSDADGDTLSISAFDASSTGGGTVSCGVTCDYIPAAGFAGDDTFTYTVDDGFGGSATATVTVSVAPAVAVDLDIKKFQVSKKGRVDRPIRVSLTVRNTGDVEGSAQAVVTGVQNGVTVYSRAVDVSDAPGNGSTRWDFPSFTPVVPGNIDWTATIADGDPDDDTATATTSVR